MEQQTIGRKTFLRLLGGSTLAAGLLAWLRRDDAQSLAALAGGHAGGSALQAQRDPRAVAQHDTL